MRRVALVSAVLLALSARPALAVEGPLVIMPVQAEPRFDNLRFGLAHFMGDNIPSLFPSGAAVSMGFDYQLGHGLAIAVDTLDLFHDYGGSAYLLSLNPVQLRYRLGLPEHEGWPLSPYLSLGTGVTAMSLFGDGTPRLGLGLAASVGVGAIIQDAFTAEIGLNAGQVGEIGYGAWQVRLGTGFASLARLGRAVAHVDASPLAGRVASVEGDRLVLSLASGRPQAGDELLVYYEDGFTVKVARARLESVSGGQATARVLVATEPVKPGYRIRAW